MEEVKTNKGITLYCHFSFRRPRGKDYGIFAVAMYQDFEGKKLVINKVRKFNLWEDHQFVTAIQAYEHALLSIYEWQGYMIDGNIRQIMLVTDNTTLAGWIEDPRKNKNYTEYMERAVKMYKVGAPKEIAIGIGLCEPRKSEKSYKFCKEDKVENTVELIDKKDITTGYKLDITGIEGVQSVDDIIANDESIPEIEGMKEIQ